MTQPNEQLIETIEKASCSECGGAGFLEICHDPYGTAPCFSCYLNGLEEENEKLKEQLQQTREELRRVRITESVLDGNLQSYTRECDRLREELEQVKTERDYWKEGLQWYADLQHGMMSDSHFARVWIDRHSSQYEVKE